MRRAHAITLAPSTERSNLSACTSLFPAAIQSSAAPFIPVQPVRSGQSPSLYHIELRSTLAFHAVTHSISDEASHVRDVNTFVKNTGVKNTLMPRFQAGCRLFRPETLCVSRMVRCHIVIFFCSSSQPTRCRSFPQSRCPQLTPNWHFFRSPGRLPNSSSFAAEIHLTFACRPSRPYPRARRRADSRFPCECILLLKNCGRN